MLSASGAGNGRCDVLIVGAGMAGLCAAVAALEQGARVTVVEKGDRIGGSMWLSNGLVWSFKCKDDVRTEVTGNEALQDLVVESLAADQRWLTTQGVELGLERPFQWYGVARVADPRQMTAALARRIEALGGEIHRGTALADLHAAEDGGYVATLIGPEFRRTRMSTASALLASGGFQGNAELLARYVTPHAERMYLRANPWSTGDGFLAAEKLGAAVTAGLRHFYGHALVAPPARFGPSQFSDATQRYGHHALALNLKGERFVDESAGTGEEGLNAAVAAQDGATAVYVIDAAIAELSIEHVLAPAKVAIARAAGFGGPVIQADSLEALAARMQDWGVPPAAALSSIRAFNAALAGGQEGAMHPPRRKNRHPIVTPPFSAVMVRAAITFTCGGIATDVDMRVLSRPATVSTLPLVLAEPSEVSYQAIPGLFAAGCDVGGISGNGYMGGLASALVTGRRAGREAALHAAAAGGLRIPAPVV